jgi:hypothetical protein
MHDWWYLVKLTYLKKEKTSQVKTKFFVSNGKIVRSFVTK